MAQTTKPDPKMVLFLSLMKDFPIDENDGHSGQVNSDDPGPGEVSVRPGPRRFDFLADTRPVPSPPAPPEEWREFT